MQRFGERVYEQKSTSTGAKVLRPRDQKTSKSVPVSANRESLLGPDHPSLAL